MLPESQKVHKEGSDCESANAHLNDGERLPTDEEVEDRHVDDVEQPVSGVIWIHLLHSVTEKGIHFPPATEMKSSSCINCTDVWLF